MTSRDLIVALVVVLTTLIIVLRGFEYLETSLTLRGVRDVRQEVVSGVSPLQQVPQE